MRLNHYISQSGIASRRGADQLIEEKQVKVNGKIAKLGWQVDPSVDLVAVHDAKTKQWITLKQEGEKAMYVLYKPKGVVTTMKQQIQTGQSKQKNELIIADLVPQSPRVFPVGRLDKESEGLIIMTNDGDFSAEITHPTSHIEKEYIVHCTIPRHMTENMLKADIGRIAKGIKIQGRRTQKSEIKLLRYLRPGLVELLVTIKEGRNRQIRRMLGSKNLEVVRLIRTRTGALSQDDLQLKYGEWKKITKKDVLK